MKESANVALGHIKSHYKDYKIDLKTLDDACLHINATETAIKKDGPSAGTALTTAIISCLTKTEVDPTIAMTGEITLTGKVLPIGGLKEKSIGAYRAGVRTILIPRKNERDIDDIPKDIRKDLSIILVNDYKEIFDYVFKKKKK